MKLTKNPFIKRGERGAAAAWEEGYEAGRNDDPCPKARRNNKGQHCEHWREGDGPCCDCGKAGTIVNDELVDAAASGPVKEGTP